MTSAARKIADLTVEEFLALLQSQRGESETPKPTERPSVVDREPPPEAYARLAARRRRKGRG